MHPYFRGQFLQIDDTLYHVDQYPEPLPEKDGVYEVIRIINGVPLFLTDHLRRLSTSMELVCKENVLDEKLLMRRLRRFLESQPQLDCNFKILLSHDGDLHRWTTYMAYIPSIYPDESDYLHGVPAITYQGMRKNPNAKVYLAELRKDVKRKLQESKAYEALLVNEEGYITEGSRSNLFLIKDGVIYTPADRDVLLGITRAKVIDLIGDYGFPFQKKLLRIRDLPDLSGAFMTGTSPKILPFRSVDGIQIENPLHPWIKQLIEGYDLLIEEEIEKYRQTGDS